MIHMGGNVASTRASTYLPAIRAIADERIYETIAFHWLHLTVSFRRLGK